MKINFNNNNLKTKIISLVTALALWLYVIAVIDPDEKKVIENIPITITNLNEISNEGFVIYPKEDLKTDITIEGKLSEIDKLNKNNIHIYGDIINPVEGQNIITLRTNISNRVSRDLKDTNFVVNLERRVRKIVDVKIKIPPNMKSSVEGIKKSESQVVVSGPRSIVNTVDYVGNTLVFMNNPDKSGETLKLGLIPYNKDSIPVENVTLSSNDIEVQIRYTMEKTVPIKIRVDNSSINLSEYTTQPETVKILGDENVLKNIEYIYTDEISVDNDGSIDRKKIGLNIPKNVRLKDDLKDVIVTRK